jgi:hypothetical protein
VCQVRKHGARAARAALAERGDEVNEKSRLANRVIGYAHEDGKNIFDLSDKDWLRYRGVGKKHLVEIRELLGKMEKQKSLREWKLDRVRAVTKKGMDRLLAGYLHPESLSPDQHAIYTTLKALGCIADAMRLDSQPAGKIEVSK